MKKVLCSVFAVVMMAAMVLSLSGCGGPKIELPTSASISFGDSAPILSASANVNCNITEITATEDGNVLLKGTCTITSKKSSFGREGDFGYQLKSHGFGIYDTTAKNSIERGHIKWLNENADDLITYGEGNAESFEITLYNMDTYSVSKRQPSVLYYQYYLNLVDPSGNVEETKLGEIAKILLKWE